MVSSLFGIVLVGGASSRMGADKASLPWRNHTFAHAALDALRPWCAEVRLAGALRQATHEVAPQAGALPDAVVDGGPLAGVVSGLEAALKAGCDRLLVVTCDAPAVQADDLAPLLSASAPACFIDDDGERWPLPCVLPVSALPEAKAALLSGRRSVKGLLARLGADGPPIGDRADRLVGANTPDALAVYRARFERLVPSRA